LGNELFWKQNKSHNYNHSLLAATGSGGLVSIFDISKLNNPSTKVSKEEQIEEESDEENVISLIIFQNTKKKKK